MAINYIVGDFQLNTITGNQSVSGLGFQPKAVMFFHQPQTVAIGVPQIANWYEMVGMTDGTNTYSMWSHSPNGSGTESAGYMQTTLAIVGGNNFSTVWGASMISLDGDGFTINVTVAPPVGYMVGYLALGGGDLDGAVGTMDASGSTGLQAETGLGFQPTGLIMNTLGRAEAYTGTPAPDFTAANVEASFGFSDGSIDRSSGYSLRDSGATIMVNGVTQSNSSIVTNPVAGSSVALRSAANVSSLDADGFTLNWTNNATTNAKHMYLAVGGVQAEVGSFFVPTSTGVSTVVSGLAFEPNAVVFTGSNQSAFNVIEGNGQIASGQGAEFTYGFATGGLEQFNIEATGVDFIATSYYGHYESDVAVQARYEYNNRATLREQCAFDAFSTDGFDFNVLTTVGSGNSLVSYLVLEGDGGAPNGGNPTGGTGGPDSPDSHFLQRFITV